MDNTTDYIGDIGFNVDTTISKLNSSDNIISKLDSIDKNNLRRWFYDFNSSDTGKLGDMTMRDVELFRRIMFNKTDNIQRDRLMNSMGVTLDTVAEMYRNRNNSTGNETDKLLVVTAPEEYTKQHGDLCLFLGGGITNCSKWQDKIIDYMKQAADSIFDFFKHTNTNLHKLHDIKRIVLFNPRQSNFDITNPNASDIQVEWEHRMLHLSDIFTMYFDASTSPQPICFYELGKYKQMIINRYKESASDFLVISTHENFSRSYDVIKQCKLDDIEANLVPGPELHFLLMVQSICNYILRKCHFNDNFRMELSGVEVSLSNDGCEVFTPQDNKLQFTINSFSDDKGKK